MPMLAFGISAARRQVTHGRVRLIYSLCMQCLTQVTDDNTAHPQG